jgi:1,4-alpha-glucan branching enzyme
MIDRTQVGGSFQVNADGSRRLRFGIYLPGVTYDKGYGVEVRVVHAADQLVRGIDPQPFQLFWHDGSPLDLWDIDIDLAAPLPDPASAGHFGAGGVYLYRFVVLRGGEPVGPWVADPFGTGAGLGGLSAVQVDPPPPFTWTDQDFRVPEVDRMVVYELHVAEFNIDFDGVTEQLDYIAGLGVNVIELMPVTEVKEAVEWGYTPLGFFAPDARFGDADSLRRLVDTAHGKGIAVIHDAVYAHAHPEFAYNLVYQATGEPNPMMGVFAGEFFSQPGTDYTKQFTRDYFLAVNQYWMDQFHIDGFRYDYVPGYWDGPTGVGYAALVHATYQASIDVPRFKPADGGARSLIVQCAENLPDPIGILSTTYSNCAWQTAFLDDAGGVAIGTGPLDAFAHQLDPNFLGYPDAYTNPATGETIPVAPFQYMESHDQSRFINRVAPARIFDLLNESLGDRSQFYRLQPYAIALMTGKGVPMLWHGQEFAEDWSLPSSGIGRNLFARPLHWEYFYDDWGKPLVRLYRVLGSLRRELRSLSSRGFFYYYDDPGHRAQGVIAFRRQANAVGSYPAEDVLVLVNVFARPAAVWVQFPASGAWIEQIDKAEQTPQSTINVGAGGQWCEVTVPSNYGSVYLHSAA